MVNKFKKSFSLQPQSNLLPNEILSKTGLRVFQVFRSTEVLWMRDIGGVMFWWLSIMKLHCDCNHLYRYKIDQSFGHINRFLNGLVFE